MGKANTRTQLKKEPKQRRSRELFEAILEAGTRILKAGVLELNTNKIAEKAGVSVGSLYQYFPGKDAILAKIVERQQEKNARRFLAIIEANRGKGVEETTDALVSEIVVLFYEQRQLFARLFSEVPRLKITREVLTKRNRAIEVFREYFTENRSFLRTPEEVDAAVYVFSHALVGVLQTAALEDFETHSKEDLIRHLQNLARRFLFNDAIV
jgi:AcrR family transcriptional regulator